MITLQRYANNPILSPDPSTQWDHDGAFNGCVVHAEGAYHMVYRALSTTQKQGGVDLRVSSVGYARSSDGIHFEDRKKLFGPDEDWEIYGVEDPRITYINGYYYICYTALSVFPFAAYGIKLAVAKTKDFKTFEKHPVTTFNSKAMGIFPDKINGKMAALLTINTDLPPAKIAVAEFNKEEDIWSPHYWEEWYDNANEHLIHLLRDMRDQVELGAPPIKTEYGWLVIYSYITNYLSNNKNFGIEAMLLDLDNPRKLLGRTDYSLISPEANYELQGDVPNIVFPSGALVKDGELCVYYGAADTRVAMASCKLKPLLEELRPKKLHLQKESQEKFARYEGNPILEPIVELPWQAKAVFNPAAVYENGKVHILYRTQSNDGTSFFGYASSKDGFHIDENLDYPVYVPREPFEQKTKPEGNSGCEDPRLTKIGDRFYVCYTAFDSVNPPRVALSSIKVDDFLNKHWHWDKPVLISPPGVDDKDACIVQGKKEGEYIAFHRLGNSIWVDIIESLHFKEDTFLTGEIIAGPREDKWDNLRLGIAGPPMETEDGWLLLYHGIQTPGNIYKIGAILLDLDNPKKVLARTDDPIFEPEMDYEKVGLVPNVVFPCGQVIIDGVIYLYYGGADVVLGVATMPIKNLLKLLKNN